MPSLPERREAAPENPLRRRISLLCRNSVKTDQDAAAAWKKGDKVPQPRRLDGEEQWVSERLKIHGDDAAEQPRRGGGQEVVAKRKNPLRRRISRRYSVEAVQDATAWKEGDKMPQPRRLEGGEQGVPERPNPLRRRSSLRYYSERLRKNCSIRGFCFLSYICICAKFFLLYCLVYVYIVNSWMLPMGACRW